MYQRYGVVVVVIAVVVDCCCCSLHLLSVLSACCCFNNAYADAGRADSVMDNKTNQQSTQLIQDILIR